MRRETEVSASLFSPADDVGVESNFLFPGALILLKSILQPMLLRRTTQTRDKNGQHILVSALCLGYFIVSLILSFPGAAYMCVQYGQAESQPFGEGLLQ